MGAGWQERRWGRTGQGGLGNPGQGRGPTGAGGRGSGLRRGRGRGGQGGVPVNLTPATLAGDTTVGSLLTVTPGTWFNADSLAYAWFRDGSIIVGEAGTTYTTVEADVGTEITAKEAATNSVGSALTTTNGITVTSLVPVVETISLTAHGSGDINITTIDGIAVSAFNMVTATFRGITQSGADETRLRLSEDGGTTYLSTATSYRSAFIQAISASGGDADHILIADLASLPNASCVLYNLNALMPTSVVSQEMETTDGNPARRYGVTKSSIVEHDAIRFYVATGEYNGGTVDLVGYR